jgi:hypothetical protein
MASIGLTTVADCKTLLQIPSGDTSQDSLLTLLIKSVSKEIETFLSRKLGQDDYLQTLAANNRQILQLYQWPTNTVTFVKESGVTLVAGQDYLTLSQYLEAGQIYRGSGWVGPAWVRGLTADPYAGQLIFEVSYNSGYLLPGDPAPMGWAGEDLPSDIQLCAMQMVSKVYGLSISGNLGENLASIKEGGLAYSFDNPAKIPSDLFGVVAGMPIQFASFLTPYRRWAVA